jgi:hypothetical protein
MISTLEEEDTSGAYLLDEKDLWTSHIMNGLCSIAHINKLARNKLSEAREVTSRTQPGVTKGVAVLSNEKVTTCNDTSVLNSL